MDDRWKTFAKFWQDMGDRPSLQHSIDRIDGTKGYTRANCRWATIHEQQRNIKSVVLLTYKGETLSLAEWGRKLGIKSGTISQRRQRGLPIEQVLYVGKHSATKRRR